jgi:ferredoxin
MAEWVVPDIDLAVCTRCGLCVELCPAHAVVMTENGPRFNQPEACTYCGDCESICPEGAIARSFVIVWETGDPMDRGLDGGV